MLLLTTLYFLFVLLSHALVGLVKLKFSFLVVLYFFFLLDSSLKAFLFLFLQIVENYFVDFVVSWSKITNLGHLSDWTRVKRVLNFFATG